MRPRTDGLYFSIVSSSSVAWLRFTDDGEAFGASSSPGCPSQIATWLRPGAAKFIPQGRYALDGDVIEFTLESEMMNLRKLERTRHHHRAVIASEGHSLSSTYSIESTMPAFDGKSSSTLYEFVAVERRCLDGAMKPGQFRALTSIAGLAKFGFDPAMLAAVKKNKSATMVKLNVYDRERLLALGLDPAFVDALIAWRVKTPA